MVHRDLKPGNLFLTRSGTVKVIDLGLARVLAPERIGEKVSSAQTVVGTPPYMAPEQWDTTEVDRRADLYALGCTLFCLLTGGPPFGSSTTATWGDLVAAHKLQTPPSARDRRPDVPPGLARLVARLLAKAPDQRPASAREVAEALAPFTAGHNLPALLAGDEATPSPKPVAGASRRTYRKPLVAVGVALVALAAIVLVGVVLWRPRPTDTGRVEPSGPVSASLPDRYTNSLGMEFVRVPRGKAWVGSIPGDREIDIPADYYLGTYEVTQEEWQKLMGNNPSSFARTGKDRDKVKDIEDEDLKRFPVETVSWDDIQGFLAKLNRAESVPGWTYRLPTVAEWQYGCRGGPMASKADGAFAFYFDPPANRIRPDQANFLHEKGLGRPCKVGSYKPNRLGLHDTYGNVIEWCEDRGRTEHLSVGRAKQGGAFWIKADQLNSYQMLPEKDRFWDVGLRVARVPVVRGDVRRKDFDAWRKKVAALPADRQAAAVADLLRVRNPAFYDQVTHRVAGGVVTELRFLTDNVTDLEPVQALSCTFATIPNVN
jgi:formylglycine-generating enzyme required for sulfatase activity